MTGRPLAEHHRAWLEGHPDKGIEWFAERIAEGFQVYHLDGNTLNNAPANLVLAESINRENFKALRKQLFKTMGAKGGRATAENNGSAYMSKLGKRANRARWKKHKAAKQAATANAP